MNSYLYLITLLLGVSWNFTEQSTQTGLDFQHQSRDANVPFDEISVIYSGLALGDINNDGWDDIFAVTGAGSSNSNPNKLFISNQDGTYTESASAWGLNLNDHRNSGPIIIDLNGDGHRDLFMGAAGIDANSRYYLNSGTLTFNDHSVASQLPADSDTYSTSAGDFDGDGDLDLVFTRWIFFDDEILWENNGSAVFTDITSTNMSDTRHQSTFTAGLVDINNDYHSDLLLTSDFGDSKYYLGNGTGFDLQSTAAITDENGMGGAFGDYDNDGDLDWFVSSIYDQDGVPEANWGISGNRLYRNDGNGQFTDVTETAGVRNGLWGWGACFADFNNDMLLDIYHVNGFPVQGGIGIDETDFDFDEAKMFINQGDGTFVEMGSGLGVNDTGQGRAILCYDNEMDGDIDILISNNNQDSKYFNNNLDDSNHYLQIKLQQPGGNMDAIGAKIYVIAGGVTQMREVIAGGSYGSTVWTTQHFGLAEATSAAVRVDWDSNRREWWVIDTVDQKITLNPKPDLIFSDGLDSL